MRINGKRVVDASRSLRISISPQDAARAKMKDPAACAAAVAILRGYRAEGVKQARVHLGRVYLEYPDKWVRYKTPSALRAEIISFDRGTNAQYTTGEYSLQKMAPTDRLRARKIKVNGPERSRHGKRKTHKVLHRVEGVRAKGANI